MHGLVVDRMLVERGVSGSKPLPTGRKARHCCSARTQRHDYHRQADRMFRSALAALDVLRRLQGREVGLHMINLGGDVTGTEISKLVFTILSAVAEAERDRIRERVAVMRPTSARGPLSRWNRSFGNVVADDGALEAQHDQQAAIAHMRALRLAGGSLRSIAAEMRLAGHLLSHEGVKGILSGYGGMTPPANTDERPARITSSILLYDGRANAQPPRTR